MTPPTVLSLAKDLIADHATERVKLDIIDSWHRWTHEELEVPRQATREHRALLELARTPWLSLVVTNVAQSLYVDGYRATDEREDRGPWGAWQANDLDARQVPLHRAALAYGQAFMTVLPGVGDDGQAQAVMRGVSPRNMLAVYADPAEDDWPLYALRVTGPRTFRLYEDEAVHFLGREDNGDLVYIEPRLHPAGVTPVVRYANQLDLEGRTDGEVEPFIPLAKRIDKTVYDRLLVQHLSSWKVRTVSGMAKPENPEEAEAARLLLEQGSLLVAEDPDTKFGTLAETPLDGLIRAAEADVETLAAASQTPAHALTGKLVNVSAEGLAVARADLGNKVEERRKTFGKSHDQALRLAALLDGDTDGARDVMARVTWADTSIRSLAQAADALGKLRQMLDVPREALWAMIPGVTKSDVLDWTRLVGEADVFGQLLGELGAQQVPPVDADLDAQG